MTITKDSIKVLQLKLDEVLKQFAADNGLVAGSSNIKFNASDFRVQVQFGEKITNPDEIDPRYLHDLKRNGALYGLNSSMVGTKLILADRRGPVNLKFVGMYASKAICINTADGKPYRWDATFIAHQIALQSKGNA